MKSRPKEKKTSKGMSRRDLLKTGMLALGSCLCPRTLLASLPPSYSFERALSFYNLHTGEAITAVYWSQGLYNPEALVDINYIMRDFRTGEVKHIDTGLLDLLHTLHGLVGSKDTLHIVSGYRSAETNALLREISPGVAGKSLHIEGKAADIRLPGCSLRNLHKAAVSLQGGGVGYYPASDFLHLDTGRVRYW